MYWAFWSNQYNSVIDNRAAPYVHNTGEWNALKHAYWQAMLTYWTDRKNAEAVLPATGFPGAMPLTCCFALTTRVAALCGLNERFMSSVVSAYTEYEYLGKNVLKTSAPGVCTR